MEKFKSFDLNLDGKLSTDELFEGLRHISGEEEAEAEVYQIMQSADLDKNGYIDYSEFVAATMNQRKMLSRKNLEHTFATFDTDGSGKLSLEEVKVMLGGNSAKKNVW